MRVISRPAAGDAIRRLLLAWLLTGAIQYTCLPAPERVLSGFSALTGQSFPLLLVGTAVCFVLLTLAGLRWRTAHWERAALPVCFGWQLALGLRASWSVPLLCAGLVVLALLLVYAAYGARTDAESLTAAPACTGRRAGLIIVIIAAAVFLVAVLVLTVFRVLSYAAPTYDFGIFSQMFHSMRTTGLPVTTCERDRVLSHFAVHVSPIYYLFLPFYALFPSPVTLEVLAGPAAGLGGHPALAHCAAARSVRCDGRPAVRHAAALGLPMRAARAMTCMKTNSSRRCCFGCSISSTAAACGALPCSPC